MLEIDLEVIGASADVLGVILLSISVILEKYSTANTFDDLEEELNQERYSEKWLAFSGLVLIVIGFGFSLASKLKTKIKMPV